MPEGVQGNCMGEFGGENDAPQWKNRVVILFTSRHRLRDRRRGRPASSLARLNLGSFSGIGVIIAGRHPHWPGLIVLLFFGIGVSIAGRRPHWPGLIV